MVLAGVINMPNFIYIIQDCDSTFLKIGRSNDPHNRIKNMQSGSSGVLRLVSTFKVGSVKAERAIHKELSEYRRNGEWFDAPVELAIQVTNHITQQFQDVEHKDLLKNPVSIDQGFLVSMATDSRMTLEPFRLLIFLLGKLDFENYIHLSQTEMAAELDMARSAVSRAMKVLVDKRIVLVSPGSGRIKCHRLNANYGWKGKIRNLHEHREAQRA
jgi:DNA-binding MarR family transcriptional regulator